MRAPTVTSVGADTVGSTLPRSIGCDELLNVCSTPFTVTISVPVNAGPIRLVHVDAVDRVRIARQQHVVTRMQVERAPNRDPRSDRWRAGDASNGAPDSTAFARRA